MKGAIKMLDNNVEPLTQEDQEFFRAMFKSLPIVAIPKESKEVEKALQEIARELKQIRHSLERGK